VVFGFLEHVFGFLFCFLFLLLGVLGVPHGWFTSWYVCGEMIWPSWGVPTVLVCSFRFVFPPGGGGVVKGGLCVSQGGVGGGVWFGVVVTGGVFCGGFPWCPGSFCQKPVGEGVFFCCILKCPVVFFIFFFFFLGCLCVGSGGGVCCPRCFGVLARWVFFSPGWFWG